MKDEKLVYIIKNICYNIKFYTFNYVKGMDNRFR